MKANRQTPHRVASISKASNLTEQGKYWDTHEFLPEPGGRIVQRLRRGTDDASMRPKSPAKRVAAIAQEDGAKVLNISSARRID
jgi:hypothetical protein